MKVIRYLAIFLALAAGATGARAGEPETVTAVKNGFIYTASDKVFRPDAGTKIVTKTDTGEAEAKLADIKPGSTIEIEAAKGGVIKKIVITKPGA
jgi:hypothetical protein